MVGGYRDGVDKKRILWPNDLTGSEFVHRHCLGGSTTYYVYLGGNYPQLVGQLLLVGWLLVVGWDRVEWCIIDKDDGIHGQHSILWALF